MIVFETPGWLDMEAITTFGLNAKPNTKSPIGYFGTGLKYALAVLLREGCKVAIYRGYDRWDFLVEEREFRGETFRKPVALTPSYFPKMRKRVELPFTTELGKGWAMWQAFRELFSNTMDEAGLCYRKDDGWTPPREYARTFILVEGAAFEEEFEQRWVTFLEEGLRRGTEGVQILDKPSLHVYYRGVRAMDLKRPSALTYNILEPMELTEDRTFKYAFYADNKIRNALVQSRDERLLDVALNADETRYEHRLDFTELSNYVTPSSAFMGLAAVSTNASARKYLRRVASAGKARSQHYTEILAQWIELEEWDEFLACAREHAEELATLLLAARPASTDPDSERITVTQPEEELNDEIPF